MTAAEGVLDVENRERVRQVLFQAATGWLIEPRVGGAAAPTPRWHGLRRPYENESSGI